MTTMDRYRITRTDGTTITGRAYPHVNYPTLELPPSRPLEQYDWLAMPDAGRGGWALITRERIARVEMLNGPTLELAGPTVVRSGWPWEDAAYRWLAFLWPDTGPGPFYAYGPTPEVALEELATVLPEEVGA